MADLAVKSHMKGPRGNSTVPFPVKLYQMLVWTEQQDLQSVVGWQPHGRSFLVRQKQRFVRDIMPEFFQQSKMSSFQRQLNLYGFNRLTTGPDQGCYYHPMFLRGRDFLCERMVRTKIKGKGRKPLPSPETEPDFYNMTYCPQLGRNKKCTSSSERSTYPAPVSPNSQTEMASKGNVGSLPPYIMQDPPSPVRASQTLVIHFRPPARRSDIHKDEELNLHTGDLAYFEGNRFHYIDMSDDDTESMTASPESSESMPWEEV